MLKHPRIASLCLVSALLVALPTRADNMHADAPGKNLVHKLAELGVRAKVQKQMQVDATHARHVLALATIGVTVSPTILVRAGLGAARDTSEPDEHGSAMAASVRFAVLHSQGLSLGVEVDAVHVRYATRGVDDERMLLILASR